ncbi:hypothetical protein LLG95_16515 [bacterium]|nr:hypothetical protein [bacterium]
MAIIHFKRKGFFRTGYSVLDEEGSAIAEVVFPFALNKVVGHFEFEERNYQLIAEGMLGRDFVLKSGESVVAKATYHASVMKMKLVIEMSGRHLTLDSDAFRHNHAELTENDRALGHVEQTGFWVQNIRAEISDEIPLPVAIYLAWIAEQMFSSEVQLTTNG